MILALNLACKPPATSAERLPEVRFTPVQASETEAHGWLLERVPGASLDRGLDQATRLLAAMAADPTARITPNAAANALGAAGYPGHASFAKQLNAGGWPEELAEQLADVALSRSQPIDVSLARRDYGDGTTLWFAGYAFRPAFVDPMPRDLALDATLPMRVELGEGAVGREAVLFVSAPNAPAKAFEVALERYQYVDVFHVPGTYRLEVVSSTDSESQVALVWTVYVDEDAPDPTPLPRGELRAPDPLGDTEDLYGALDRLRAEAGLHALERFELYEPLAREHSAFMAHTGVVDHVIPGVTEGVAARARARFHPKAKHHEDLAAASTWEDALALVELSPGHLRNLHCETCTHVSIGTALEPTTARSPLLYVTWELLEFPQGTPRPLEEWNR